MAMITWPRARWHGLQLLRAVGLPGWTAVVLALLCAVGIWSVVEPMRDDARQLDSESAALERRWAPSARADASAPEAPQQQLFEFKQRFPDEKGLAPALRLLHAAARRQRLAIDQAEFRFASESTEPLARYSILLPLKSDYRALRRFTQDVLRELPALALEEVNLSRSDPKSPTLEAQLRFVLFVTQPSATSLAPAAAQSN